MGLENEGLDGLVGESAADPPSTPGIIFMMARYHHRDGAPFFWTNQYTAITSKSATPHSQIFSARPHSDHPGNTHLH